MPIQGITPNYFEDIKSRDDIGVPGESPYIPNGDEPITPQETGDAASVDGSSSSSQPGSTTPMSGDYDSGYIENSDEYNNSVGHATDSLDNSEATVDDMFAGINDSDYISDAGNGYQSVNGDKLAKLLVFLNLLTNAQMALKMVLDSQDELSSKLHEILFDIQAEEGADEATASAKERMFKNAKEKLKIVQQFISSLYKKVYNHNIQVYQQRMREIEKEKEDRAWYDDVGNYFSGGQQDIDNEKKKLEATRQYGDAVGANMRALEQALMTMAIVFEQMNTPEGRQMGKQLESMAKQIKYIMEGAMSRRADWQSDYYDGAGMDYFYDSLMNFRGKMVQTENLYRALAYMQSAQQEISDSVRETVLEISPHASKLQYRMIASEGLFGMANMFFDNAYNTLQMKVKAFNTEVQICKNIEKLKEAQGWKIAGVVLSVVAIALSIVATVVTFGGATPLVVAAWSMAGAIAGLGAAGMQSMGSYMASQVDDSYDVNSPNFKVSDNINLTKHKKPSEVIDEAEQTENEIINQMGGAGLLEQTQDGYWNLNSRALAAFEIRQQSLHNLVKMIAYLKKAQRDLNRAIMGIVLEKAIKDHGEGYLLSNIENSIHQRQMMMQAIKFQLQEQVTGRNIARQNEIMASKAIWSSTAGIIGAVGCAALAAIPGAGGWSVVPAFMSIGSAVGSSLYNYIESHSKSSGYGMNYESHSEEFSRLMAERKKTATEAKIAEDKLYQMENAAYEELLANGSVGTGDGYTGVNYTAVGKAYQQMLSIQNIRQYLMELRNAQIRLSASTRRQVLGISTSETTDLSGIVAQRGLSQAMAIVAAITRMLSDKSAVQNRARDAQKQARMATFSLVANVSIAGVGMGMGYSPNALGIGKTAADVSRNVTPGLMGLVNATGSLIMNALWARDDYGAYNNYSSDRAVKEIRGNRRQKTEQDTFDKLAALEDQVFQEMGENIVQSMDSGVGSVNGEITGILNTRMHAINNLRKSLLILMSARDQFSQAIRRKVGVGGGPIADANELASPQERITQQILNSLTQGVQTLLERQNQISQYERQQFIGSVSVVLSAASVALGAIAAVKGSNAEEVQEKIDETIKMKEANPQQAQTAANTSTAAPTQTGQPPTQPTAQTARPPQGAQPTTASARPNAPAGQSRPTVGTAQVPGTPTPPARNVEGLDPAAKAKNLRELAAQRDTLSNSARNYQLASGSVALVNTFWNFYGGVLVFDPAQDEKKSSVSNSKLDVVRDGQTAKKSSALQTSSSSSSDSGGGIYESTGANEADALQSEVMISSYSSPTAANIALQRAEQMISTWQSGIQQGAGTAAYLKSQDKPIILPESQRGAAIPGELAEGSRINLNSGTIEQTYSIVKDHSDPVAFVKTEVDQGRLSRDRATILLNRLETDRPELKPQIDPVRASLAAAASQPTAPAQPGQPATPYQQDTSTTASRSRALIAHADELLSHQQARATNTSSQVTTVQVDVRAISAQLVDVDTQVQAVQAKIPNATGSEHTSLTQQLSALKQRRDQLVTLFNDKVREVNRLETQIRALRTTSTTEIDHEIAALEQLKRDVNIPPQEVRDIDAKINMLRQARPQREREIQQAEQRLAQVKQEIGQIKGQLTQINQHIAQVQRELEKEKEKTSKRELDSDDKKSASATAGVRGSVVRAVGNLGNGRGNGGNGQGNGYKDRADQLQEEEDKVLASTNHGSTIGGLS